jgi:5-methylcytosine-specific restriction protein A
LEEGVWNDFAGDAPRLNNIAFAIEANLNEQASSDIGELQEIDEAEEGRILTRAHLVRERSRKLVEAKKTAVLRTTGTLACEVCGFDFSVTYGDRGTGFIEVHHALPIHLLAPGTKTKLDDLHLLCANCHRMIHSRRPWFTLDQLRAYLHK